MEEKAEEFKKSGAKIYQEIGSSTEAADSAAYRTAPKE
jgi:hypothetical protein